jgi:hypothetical protein
MNKNKKLLSDFTEYCAKNPNLRFWQALRNWCGYNFVYLSNEQTIEPGIFDTFYWETKNGKDK